MTAWINGELTELAAAKVSVLDHGLVVGDGVFETLRVYDGTPFAWSRHFARLRTSAEGLDLQLPAEIVLRDAADAVLHANQLTEARLRITVTGGNAPPGSGRGGGPSTAFVLAFPFEPAAASIDAVIAPWTRNENGALAGLKTISYAANVRALAFARAHGAGEAIFANTQGNLCEATGSNVFCVVDGGVVTPPPSAGCLQGVTRALLLELAERLGIPAEARDIPINEFARAGEAFLSSTTREVQPIAHIDGRPLATVCGPISAQLAAGFRELVGRDVDP